MNKEFKKELRHITISSDERSSYKTNMNNFLKENKSIK
jgi:hypothetical protein